MMAYAKFAFESVAHVTKALVHSLKCDVRRWELKEVFPALPSWLS